MTCAECKYFRAGRPQDDDPKHQFIYTQSHIRGEEGWDSCYEHFFRGYPYLARASDDASDCGCFVQKGE